MKINFHIHFKELLITLVFCVSIFFWSSSIFELELRFLILLLFFGNIYNLKKNINWFSILLIFHSILISIYLELSLNKKLLATYIFLYLITSLTFFYVDTIKKNILNMIYFYAFILFFLLIFQIIFSNNENNYFINCYVGCFSLNKFIYQENSHFGVTIAPIIIFLAINIAEKFKFKKMFSLIFLMFLSFFNYSNSLLLIILLTSIGMFIFDYKNFKSKRISPIIVLSTFSLILYLSNSADFNQRFVIQKFDFPQNLQIDEKNSDININKKNEKPENKTQIVYEVSSLNLSTEVILKSFKISLYSFMDNLLGVGINNFEYSHDKYIDKINVVHWESSILNKQDGTNNFNKIFAEFGIIGLVYLFSLFYFFFFTKAKLDYKYFIISLLCAQTFIRGYGYFNGGFLIILSLLIYEVYYKNNIFKKIFSMKKIDIKKNI